MYQWRTKALDFVHAQDNLNLHILHMFKGTFSLDVAHIIYTFIFGLVNIAFAWDFKQHIVLSHGVIAN